MTGNIFYVYLALLQNESVFALVLFTDFNDMSGTERRMAPILLLTDAAASITQHMQTMAAMLLVLYGAALAVRKH